MFSFTLKATSSAAEFKSGNVFLYDIGIIKGDIRARVNINRGLSKFQQSITSFLRKLPPR